MSLPRLSIRAMLLGVLLVAGDCAAWRIIRAYSHANPGLALGIISVMPMSNILAVVCYRRLTGVSPVGPFFVGFGLSGAMAILIWFTLWRMADGEWLNSMLVRFELGVEHSLDKYKISDAMRTPIFWLVVFLRFAVLDSLPQLMSAMAGGWIARRYAANPQIQTAPAPGATPTAGTGGVRRPEREPSPRPARTATPCDRTHGVR